MQVIYTFSIWPYFNRFALKCLHCFLEENAYHGSGTDLKWLWTYNGDIPFHILHRMWGVFHSTLIFVSIPSSGETWAIELQSYLSSIRYTLNIDNQQLGISAR